MTSAFQTSSASGAEPSSQPFLRVPRNAAILAVIWLVSILAALLASQFGRYAIATNSGDWAAHMYIVESDYHNAGLPANSPDRLITQGELANYPHLGHYIVGLTSYLLDLNPLRSMQVWTLIALVSGCWIMATRLAFFMGDLPSIPAVLLTAVWLAAAAYAGFGIRGHIEENFFFAQFFGTVLALGGLAVLQRMRAASFPVLLAVVLWGGVVLTNIHLVPALWFILAALVHLVLSERSLAAAGTKSALVAGGSVLLAALSPATHAMVHASDNNGWFLIRFGQLADHGVALAVGLSCVLALLICLLVRLLLTRRWIQIQPALLPYAGLISVCCLIALQSIVYLGLHRGSVYAVAKYTYLLALEMSILIVSIRYPSKGAAHRFVRQHSGWVTVVCVTLFFIAQGPFIATPYDQDNLMKTRERLQDLNIIYNPQHRVYPQFPSFDYDRNYYLAIAVMRIPQDARTIDWLMRGAQGEEAFTWPSGASPALKEDPALSKLPSSSYKYDVHLAPADGIQVAPATYQIPRTDLLKIDIADADEARFKLATSIPASKGFVLLGYYTFDKSSKQLEQGRCLLVKQGNMWHAEIKISSSVASVEFSPVQEWITWFYWEQPPNIRKVVFLDR